METCTQSPPTLTNHDLAPDHAFSGIRYERRPLLSPSGTPVDGLFNIWIWLDNPRQFNSYTTQTIRDVILAFRRASCDRAAVAVVFTGVGDKAFCTGGNTREYAEYYAGNPQEYRQYMRLFNDMVTGILTCDKPVINRVNGMRIGGGQEIGMACDFTVAADTARFGQAGPRHGSAPDGGATDFLDLYIGFGRAMESCVLCEPMSAHEALRLGLVNRCVAVLRHGDKFIANPLVVTDRYSDDLGNIVFGKSRTGEDLRRAKEILASCVTDQSLLDAAVEGLCTRVAHTMPDCTTKTVESIRKKKLAHWQKNCETNRAWLALNMMTEGKAGFRAFNDGPKDDREVDFIALRLALARGEPWTDSLIREISPQYKPAAEACACSRM